MNYKITEVSPEINDWENSYGKYRSFLVRFEGIDGQVEISRKKQQDGTIKNLPEVGQSLSGDITTKANGVQKFKQDYSSGGAQAPQTASNGSKPDEAYWAKRNAQIISQSSRRDAIDATRLEVEAGTFKPKDTEAVAKRIKSWEVKFEQAAYSAEPPKENPLDEPPF